MAINRSSFFPLARHTLALAAFVPLVMLAGPSGAAQDVPYKESARPSLPIAPGIDLETVCGSTDELEHVALYKGPLSEVAQNESTTVQLQWQPYDFMNPPFSGYAKGNVEGKSWCTGTLIAPDKVLTAGHCFDVLKKEKGWDTPQRLTATGQLEYVSSEGLARLMQVNFGNQVNKDRRKLTPRVVQVAELLEYRKGNLDYAIIKLESSQTIDSAELSNMRIIEGQPIGIIQHPYIKGKLLPDLKRMDAGHLASVSVNRISYSDLDTHGGASGAGVRLPDGSIIGIHTHGGCTGEGGSNFGVPIRSIGSVSDIVGILN